MICTDKHKKSRIFNKYPRSYKWKKISNQYRYARDKEQRYKPNQDYWFWNIRKVPKLAGFEILNMNNCTGGISSVVEPKFWLEPEP